MLSPFEIFDNLLNEAHSYPLDAQYHITRIQSIDRKIMRYTKKLQKHLKLTLRSDKEDYTNEIKRCLSKLALLNKKRKFSLNIITKLTHEIFSIMEQKFPKEWKADISNPLKNPSIIKTKINKEDVSNLVKQPKYCLCRTYAFGDMVRCDDPECKIVWYHYECVGLMHSPKGNWHCDRCKQNKIRKNQ